MDGTVPWRAPVVYRLLADAVVAVHLAFLGLVVLGGFAAWAWRWVLPWHLLAAAYGALVVLVGWACPLTELELWLRERGGEPRYTGGFIDHYLTGVLYPADAKAQARVVAAAVVVLSWLALLASNPSPPPPRNS